MSYDTCIAYFGIRFEIGFEEIENLETRSDDRIAAAQRVGLKYYWGNFGDAKDVYLMFIGMPLGIMGRENSAYIALSSSEMDEIIDKTSVKLIEAGFEEFPAFHLQWQPDI